MSEAFKMAVDALFLPIDLTKKNGKFVSVTTQCAYDLWHAALTQATHICIEESKRNDRDKDTAIACGNLIIDLPNT